MTYGKSAKVSLYAHEMKKLHVPLSDEHFRAIGRISVHFEYLHQIMLFWLWQMIGQRQRIGQIVTGGMPFGGTLRVLGALVVEYSGNDRRLAASLDRILMRAVSLEETRNEVVHSVWGGGGAAPIRLKTRVKRSGIHFDDKARYTVAELDAIADRIEQTSIDLQEWFIAQCPRDETLSVAQEEPPNRDK